MPTLTATAESSKVTYVSFDGPEPVQNRDGDEVASFSVNLCDDDDDVVQSYGPIYSYGKALKLAQDIARDRKLEFVNNASRP